MPQTFDLPRNDSRQLGMVLGRAIESAKVGDAAAVYSMSQGVREYLLGNRNFEIFDPYNPGYLLMRVEIPRNQPAYEALVSDVSQEIGRQQRMDTAPNTGHVNTAMQAIRDAAVAKGVLNYYFPEHVTDAAHRAFQKYRVEDGCAGLAVSPCMYPGSGWGLKLTPIPVEEILFLPIAVRSWNAVEGIVWRKWVTLRWLKRSMAEYANRVGQKIRIPNPGSNGWEKMRVIKVPAGMSLRQTLMGYDGRLLDYNNRAFGGADSDVLPFDTEFVEFSQVYVTPPPQHRYVERCIKLAGDYVMTDTEYPEEKMPMMPLGVGRYADVGGPYGRSYAWPKMMAHIDIERLLKNVSRNASDIDAYGLLALSSGMGVQGDMITRTADGFRIINFNADPTSPTRDPIQISPANLQNAYGSLPQMFFGAADKIFPISDIFQGDAPGRVDSDIALKRLELLSNTQIAAGSKSAASAWAQCYAAGLELANNHHQDGDTIPLVQVDDSMAGIVLDTMNLPLSSDEQQQVDMQRARKARYFIDQGVDPMLGSQLALNGLAEGAPDEGPDISNRQVPVGRFRIGPNTIPHPDMVRIGIMSLLPRDRDAEYMEAQAAIASGMASISDVQIYSRVVGLNKYVGNNAVWYTYQTAVLNLLSAFADGQESGPIIIPQPFTFVPQIGYMVMSTFMCSDRFHLASDTVKQKMFTLLEIYNPVNTPGTQLTADEAAAQHQQMLSGRNRAGRGGALPPAMPSRGQQPQGRPQMAMR